MSFGTSVALRDHNRGSRNRAVALILEAIMSDDLDKDGQENQVKGFGKQVEGRVRNAVGGLTGDTSEQIKGKAKELDGKVQRKIGDAQRDDT
jgi:uncharacterized protein YjbJ (UPF0337 family)